MGYAPEKPSNWMTRRTIKAPYFTAEDRAARQIEGTKELLGTIGKQR
jgi:hypothetical protein